MSRSPWLAGILVLAGAFVFASCDDGPESPTAPSAIPAVTPITAELRIALYDELLRLDLPSDVRQVFESNRNASFVAHLPTFERCS